MPQVPVIPTFTTPEIAEQVAPNVKFGSPTSLETFGGGASAAGPEQAAQHALGVSMDLVNDERRKADQIAVTDADTKLNDAKTDAMYNPQSGYYKLKGKDALAAASDTVQDFKDTASDIMDDLSPQQQRMFAMKAANHISSFNAQVQQHAFQQGQEYDTQSTDANIKSYADQAVTNYQNPGAVEDAIANQKQTITDYNTRNGVAPEKTALTIQTLTSQTRSEVMQRMLANGDTDVAQDFYNANKDLMTGADQAKAESQLKSAKILVTSQDTWGDLQGMKLSDGKPDEARMQAAVFANDDLAPEEKEKVWDYVRAKANEAQGQLAKQRDSNERDFLNAATGLKNDGSSVDDALKLIPQYAIDPYDAQTKEIAVKKLWAPREASDPTTYMKLWDGIQDGSTSRQDLDDAMKKDQISVTDWRELSKQNYKTDIEGNNPQVKLAYEHAKIQAEQALGNSDKQAVNNFMYDLHTSTQGQNQTPEQIQKMATDKLKSDPSTGSWFFGMGKQKVYETDLQKTDAANLAWGQAYSDLGKPTVMHIGAGMSKVTGQPFSPAALNDFSKSLGGYDAIKPGTPANNAIQSLIQKGASVTPNNVNTVLSKYPDGKF